MDIFDGLKNKLQNYESPMNQDEVWAELLVQKRARERSKKKRIIWLFFGCFFGLGGILYWVGSAQWAEQPIAQNNHKPSNEIAIDGDHSSTKKRDNGILGSTSTKANNTIVERTALQNASRYLSKHSSFRDKNTLLQKNYNAAILKTSQNTPSATSEQTMSSANSISRSQDMEKSTLLASSLVGKADSMDITTYPLIGSELNATSETKLVQVDHIQPLSTVALPSKIDPFEKNIIIPTLAFMPVPNIKSKHFEVYAGSGVFSTQQRFSTQDNMNKDFVALRNETETNLTTFAFDAGVNYWFSNKNFVSIGLQHNSWYDRFNYTYEQPREYTYENIVLRILKNEQLGTEESQYGDTVVQGSEIVKMTHFNKYASTNLRLLLGRQIWSRNRLSLDLAGGMDWSVSAKAQGNIAAPISTGGILDLQNTGGNTIYKKSLGIGLSGAIGVNYRLNQHWAIQFRPSATYFLSDAARANSFAEARFYRFGAMLGLRYRL